MVHVLLKPGLEDFEHYFTSLPGSSAGQESACNVGDPIQLLGWEDPLEKG